MKKIIVEILIFILSILLFWFLIFPISLILRIFRHSLFDLKKENKETYWIEKKNKTDFDN
tara:strand:+ start:29721 stop:29900 length:180 start_codon:yes stop_codon:yes gene_type:complete